jgi:hypothetical protein
MLLENIRFEEHQAAKVEIHSNDEISSALKTLGFDKKLPVIVVIGGAGGVREEDWEPIRKAMDTIGLVAHEAGATIVDGGTDSGVMAINGEVRIKKGYTYPLIGVAAVGTVKWPGRKLTLDEQNALNEYAGPLDPNHTHFILTPGNEWGDESPWLAEIATQLSGNKPSVAVLINGGNISRDQDVPNNMKAGRPVLVIEGTGRAADEFATQRPSAKLMQFIHVSDPDILGEKLKQHLQPAA